MNTQPIEYIILFEKHTAKEQVIAERSGISDSIAEIISRAYVLSAMSERPVTVKLHPLTPQELIIPVAYTGFPGIPTGTYYNNKQIVLCNDYLTDGVTEYFNHEQAIELAYSTNGVHLPSDEEHKILCRKVSERYNDFKRTMQGDFGIPISGYELFTKVWKYKLGGYKRNNEGEPLSVGNGGYSWSSSVSGTGGVHLSFSYAGLSPSSASSRAYGFQVRCLQD